MLSIKVIAYLQLQFNRCFGTVWLVLIKKGSIHRIFNPMCFMVQLLLQRIFESPGQQDYRPTTLMLVLSD